MVKKMMSWQNVARQKLSTRILDEAIRVAKDREKWRSCIAALFIFENLHMEPNELMYGAI